MRRRKRTKTIDDVSVTKLLDDFVDLDVEDDSKRKDMDDNEYIRMMIEKENQRKLVRERRTSPIEKHDDTPTTPDEGSEKIPLQVSEPVEEVFPETCDNDLSPEDEAEIEGIMKTQGMMDEPVLTGSMKASVEFLQEKVKSSEAKRSARKTLEKYRKDSPTGKKKEVAPTISKKRAPLKRCQSCYFCVEEKKISGSCWCHCTNPGRSTHAIVKGSWVKSRMNLPCWKPPQE